jgi:hypothetical protein
MMGGRGFWPVGSDLVQLTPLQEHEARLSTHLAVGLLLEAITAIAMRKPDPR